MTKPIDLIVANVMHEAAPLAAQLDRLIGILRQRMPQGATLLGDADPRDDVARKLLCVIAHDASMSVVYAALKVCDAPCSAELIGEGLQAVRDRAGS